VRLALTPSQVEQLAPLAIKAGLERKSVLFVTSVVPSWSTEEGETDWELQVVTVSAPLGSKIVRLIAALSLMLEGHPPFIPSFFVVSGRVRW
jgi:hypothetical protein